MAVVVAGPWYHDYQWCEAGVWSVSGVSSGLTVPRLARVAWSLPAWSAPQCLLTTCSPKYLFWPGRQPHCPALPLVERSPPLCRPMRGRILIKLCGREGLSLTLWQTPFNLSLLAIATLLLHKRSLFSEGISTKQNKNDIYKTEAGKL